MSETFDRVTVAQDVLNTIVRLTTLGVPGVARLGGRPSLRRGGEAVQVDVSDDSQVHVEVYVIVHSDMNLRDVAHAIQQAIARSMNEMVGMQVAAVNVHIQDVEAPTGK